jgi:hypothetical protein
MAVLLGAPRHTITELSLTTNEERIGVIDLEFVKIGKERRIEFNQEKKGKYPVTARYVFSF